jgi:hypothetical protein
MLSGLIDPATRMPHAGRFWLVFGGLIVAQLLALWGLCSHQVRKAEARQTERTVQQLALADCLQYIPGATIATCNSRIAQMGAPAVAPAGAAPAQPAVVGAPAARGTGALPVSFSR